MGNLVFVQGLGKVAGWAEAVNFNEPTNCAFIISVWNAGAATDATVKDLNTVQDLIDNVDIAEVTNTGYARKTLDQTGGLTAIENEGSDLIDVDCPDQTWTAVAAGTAWTDIAFGFDRDTTAGVDADIQTGTWHDFAVTPDGSDITAQIATAGFFRAS